MCGTSGVRACKSLGIACQCISRENTFSGSCGNKLNPWKVVQVRKLPPGTLATSSVSEQLVRGRVERPLAGSSASSWNRVRTPPSNYMSLRKLHFCMSGILILFMHSSSPAHLASSFCSSRYKSEAFGRHVVMRTCNVGNRPVADRRDLL